MTKTPAGHEEAHALIDALVQTAFIVTSVLNRVAADNSLSLTQLRVLGILRDRRPRMAELATFLGLEKSTLSGLVERAEQRGLLARGRNADDGRAVDVFLTPAGLTLAARVQDDVRRSVIPQVAALRAEEQRSLLELLDRMLGSSL